MSVALRLAARELRGGLRGGLRGFRIFLACLALGVAAIAAVGLVREAIEAGLEREGARLLGGDAEAELTYRFADEAERAWLASVATRVSENVDFRSLAVADPEGRVITIGLVKDGEELPPPESVATLDDLSDVVEAPSDTTTTVAGDTTTTTVAGDTTTTTVAGDATTTTVAGDATTTTVAPTTTAG